MLTEAIRQEKVLAEFDRPLVVANYFGFHPIKGPKITDKDIENARYCSAHPHYDAVERAALIRTYVSGNLSSLPHPLAISYKKPARPKRPAGYSLHFIGAPSGIAEAMLIRSAVSILSEEGYKNLRLDVNCIGDKDSLAAYERELGNHIRKLGSQISPESRNAIKDDVFNIFRMNEPEIMAIRERAPSSINFLSSQSRLHFKEVLEAIEALGIEFRLTPELVGERNHASHTIFAVRNASDDAGECLAVGYRYSRLARRLGMRKDVPMAGANIIRLSEKESPVKTYKGLPKSRFYLVQLGQEAKLKALSILEELRGHRIKVHHFLGKDKLSAQLAHADELKVSHMIIVGRKEALDSTAIVRNISTRAQDTVALAELPGFLKKLPI